MSREQEQVIMNQSREILEQAEEIAQWRESFVRVREIAVKSTNELKTAEQVNKDLKFDLDLVRGKLVKRIIGLSVTEDKLTKTLNDLIVANQTIENIEWVLKSVREES